MHSKFLLALCAAVTLKAPVLRAASIAWIGGNADWNDGASNDAKWNPADEPDVNDAAVFNTANNIEMRTSNAVNGLTLSNGATLFLNGFSLTVDGLSTIGASLWLDEPVSLFSAQSVNVVSGGLLFVDGGEVRLSVPGAGSDAILNIASGGTLSGNGLIMMNDNPGGSVTLITNDGTLTAINPVAVISTTPPPATLHLDTANTFGRIDLDGTSETGAVNVSRNQTLDVDIPLTDAFNGALTMSHNSTLDIAGPWTLGTGGSIHVKNGAVSQPVVIPAAASFITGGPLTQAGGTLTVADDSGILQFDTPFTMSGGSFVTNGHVYFNRNATFGGTVGVGGGAPSLMQVRFDSVLEFKSTSAVLLAGDLQLSGVDIRIEAGAAFSGTGSLIVPPFSHIYPARNSLIDVPLDLQGILKTAGDDRVGVVNLRELNMVPASIVYFEMAGAENDQFDRLAVSGAAHVGGELQLDIDGDFDPEPGTSFDLITATGGITGRFAGTITYGLAAGKIFEITYGPTFVRATVHAGKHFDLWIQKFPAFTNPADRLRTADPDHDGLTNLAEFALNSDPAKSSSGADRLFPKVLWVEGADVFTLTFPVRYTASVFPPFQPPGEVRLLEPEDSMTYHVQGTGTLNSFPLAVEEVSAPFAVPFHYSLPPLEPGWRYVTFRTPGPVAGDRSEFMRVLIKP